MKFLFSCWNNISWVHYAHSWYIFQHAKKNFVSLSGRVISSIYAFIHVHKVFITRSLYTIVSPTCVLIKMVKYLCFKHKKDNKCGKMVREMDCIVLRDWISRRITESQSRHINWFGMYAVNINKIGTMYQLPVFVTETWFYTLFMTQFGRLLRL